VTLRLALLFILQLAGTAPAPSPGSVEGTVIRAGNREPIEEAQVVLISTTPSEDPTRAPASRSAITDGQGKFSVKNVPPGTYRLTFSANGYVRQEYGQRAFPGRGTQITVSAGQAVKDLIVNLTPTGTVMGTIRDPDKNPLAGVPVQLMRDSYDEGGERLLRPNGTAVRTDDRGEFRIFFVTPGRYYLNAGTPSGPPGTGDPRPLTNEVPETYANVFSPGVTDLKLAMPIDVRPGMTVTGADITLKKIAGVRVTGRVIDATTGKAPESAKVKLAYRDPGVPWDYDLEYMGRGKVVYNKDGTFEFQDVLPGMYAVVATVDIPDQPKPPQGTTPFQRISHVPLEVRNTNVEGIVVTASPGASIEGRIRVEGQSEWTSAFQSLTGRYSVTLPPSSNGVRPGIPGVPQPTNGAINPDGTFRIDNVMPGEYRIQLAFFRPTFYIKEARFGTDDILARPFRFSGNESGRLEILLSPNVGSIEGTVTNNRLAVAPGVQVVLIPDKARHRIELFKTATTNQNGRFTFANLPPGDYKLYAWEAVELYRWFDPEFLKAFDQFAVPVRVGESSRQTVDARLIPSN
jgi:5-hydroxyisourate hydrolase-like protein (transthyretin family)